MTDNLAVRYTAARTLQTGPAMNAPPGPGEVELAPAFVGICGTDLHIFHRSMKARVSAPAVLGHEMPGRIVRVGPGVAGPPPASRRPSTCCACGDGCASWRSTHTRER